MNPASTEASAVATAAQDPESSSSHQSEDLEQNTSMSMPQQEGRNEEQEEEEEEEDVVELDKEDDDDDDEEHKAHNIIKVLKSQATQQHQQVVAVHHPHVMPVIPLMSAKPVTVQGSMTYGAHPIQHYHLHTTQYPYPYQQHQHHHHPYQYFHQHYVAPAPSTATATAHPHPSPQPMSALPPHPLHAPPPPPPPHHHPPPPPPSPQQYYVYPPPMATHKDLIDNRELFFTTLSKFHLSLGTKLTVPKIGGKDLDLHALYKEVTDRGGLERVITERKWKEITVVLNFPRTTTSASFVLRKYYINLLHHYEQVHYFRVQGLPVAPPVHSPNLPVPITQSAPSDFKYPAALESPDKESRKRKMDSAQALGVDPASSIGSIVTGCIDAKLDYAYLVTVMVGTRKMRGVLYHVPPASGSRPQGASVSSLINMLEPQPQAQAPAQAQTAAAAASDSSRNAMVLDPCTRIGMGTRHRRRHMSRKDPNAPRQNRTGYNFFFAEQRAKLKSVHPDKDRAISKMIGDLWGRLSEDEKSPYQERGLEDRERYRREMREYKERLRMGGCVGGLGLHSSSSSSIRTSATAKKLDSFRNFGAAQQSSRPTPVQERKEQLLLQSRSDVPTMTRPCNSSHHCHSEFGKACDSMDSQDNPTSSDKNFVEGSQT